jgi:hypothetical protein
MTTDRNNCISATAFQVFGERSEPLRLRLDKIDLLTDSPSKIATRLEIIKWLAEKAVDNPAANYGVKLRSGRIILSYIVEPRTRVWHMDWSTGPLEWEENVAKFKKDVDDTIKCIMYLGYVEKVVAEPDVQARRHMMEQVVLRAAPSYTSARNALTRKIVGNRFDAVEATFLAGVAEYFKGGETLKSDGQLFADMLSTDGLAKAPEVLDESTMDTFTPEIAK